MRTVDDARREAALATYRLIGAPPRRDLEALVGLAALVCRVPMAVINVVTRTEQHTAAAVGFNPVICAREDSLCAVTIALGEPVVVPDASRDERFRDHPWVTGELGAVRFYGAHPLCTPDGTVFGTLCVLDTEPRQVTAEQRGALAVLAERVVDVLELELSHGRLAAAHDRLAVSNERLGAFAGQVSHDLKNPLAAIMMSLELAHGEVEHLPDADGVLLLLERATRGARRMQELISHLLEFARSGEDVAAEPVDLAALIEAVVEDLGEHVQGAEVSVRGLPEVTGDPVQLRIVLQNLVGNAIKFTAPLRRPQVTVVGSPSAGRLRVEVVDNGPGVPAHLRERVFEPFARIDPAVPGTGIGLSVCRRIVEAHGGRIGLAEAPGGGTCAWFELPA